MIELVDGKAPAVTRLRQVAALRAALDAAEARAILDLATEVDWDENAEFTIVGTRPVRIGADGTRLVDEFVPLEIAAAQGISVDTAMWQIRDIVNLHARHPAVWQAVQHGRLPLWRARQIASYIAHLELSAEEALTVDEQVRSAIGRVGWKRLWWLVRAAVLKVAPERVRAITESSKADRFVRTGPVPDDPTVSFLSGRLDTGDALSLDGLLDEVADALAAQGATGSRDELRARAIGLIADPAEALALLETAGQTGTHSDGNTDDATDHTTQPDAGNRTTRRRSSRRRAQVYVHLAADQLHPAGVARVEGMGPVMVEQLGSILGTGVVQVTPVFHTGEPERAVDGYDIPAPIRRDVILRDRYEIFPFSTRDARRTDLDHTIPYRPGVPAQTRPSNLGPLSRRPHRGKTHGGWRLWQPRSGVFWWRSPRGQTYRIGSAGTWNLTNDGTPGAASSVEQLMLWYLDRQEGTDDVDAA